MAINDVTIGDTYIEKGKGMHVCKVVDFHTVTNTRGKIVRFECIAEKTVSGKVITFQVPFSTVVRQRTS